MNFKNNEYRKLSIAIFFALAAAIGFFFIIFRLDAISDFFNTITVALQPLLGGIAMAYILRPIQRKIESTLKGLRLFKKNPKLVKIPAVIVTVLFFLTVITTFVLVVAPQLINSITGLVRVLPRELAQFSTQINEYLEATNTELYNQFQDVLKSAQNMLTSWITNDLLGSAMTVVNNVILVVNSLISLFITMVVMVYLLLAWDHYRAQCKKLFVAVSKNEKFNQAAFETVAQVNRIFNGFITGKLLDSLIIGILCFMCMTLLKLPYALLISVIIGVTNIVPVFGPFIGAVPSAFLILLVSPTQCLVFLIFILILQQIDGNVIGPRILGNSTGLSALYVTIAMLLFSKLFGFIGMIIGVPLFATIYYLIKRYAEAELKKRNLPTDTSSYL